MQNLPTKEHFSVPTTEQPYQVQDWQKGYESQRQESAYWLEDIEGEIPKDLQGTLFRNGPGLLDINGREIAHPFDGDGLICAITFKGGRAYFRNRFVRTAGFIKEQKAGKILYRGVFGTQKPGGLWANAFDFKIKNIANTNVIYWGEKLLALWEAAEPHSLNPATLQTFGLDYLDGILAPGDPFAAHPKIDPSCQMDNGAPCLVNFAIKPGFSTTIIVYELAPDGQLLRRREHQVPGFAFIHDFAITPNYCIFFQNPVKFNPIPFVLGFQGAGEGVEFQPKQPTKIVVIPRNPSQKSIQIWETKAGFVFHHANAFETEDNRICIDSICYESFPKVEENMSYKEVEFDLLSPGQLWRFTLDLKSERVKRELVESRCCEFPALHPEKVGRTYQYLFMGAAHQATGNAPLQAILKLNLTTGERQLWSAAPKGYVNEPIFVPKPNAISEDDGWVLTMVYDASHHRSDLVILDGRDLNGQPVAKLHLKYHIPYGLHGSWTPQCFNF
ncbi:MAG: carotenoid oxygenase family protein [Oscillatoria sp. PMC 1051.18]|nr:carotenoid oxygenase family protein [Oscillatoria sp. PMC 1050.18]MEC5029939.1 carotenoid oxygenase family protein [Oscillatoria sp. PMC 1051.18]